MKAPHWRNTNKDLVIGAFTGLVLSVPLGLKELPVLSQAVTAFDMWGVYSAISFLLGFFVGVHLISRANPDAKKRGAFSCILVVALSIGFIPFIRALFISNLDNLSIQVPIFMALALAMLLGGTISYWFSKTVTQQDE
jgi:hypothetical protein